MSIKYVNPNGLLKSPVFTQGIIVPVNTNTLIIGGQNGVDETGQLIGQDLGRQTEKAIDNVLRILADAGGKIENLVRLGIYVKGDVDIRPGFQAWMKIWGQRPNPPTIVVLRVAGLGMSPDTLVEIEATAII